MKIKKEIGKLLKKIFPSKYYRLIANGFIIIPAYYKGIIEDTEKHLGYALNESDETEMLLLRKYAHIIDKGLHRQDAEPGHSKEYYRLLKQQLQKLSSTAYVQDPTYVWAQEKMKDYEILQSDPQHFHPLKDSTRIPFIDYPTLLSLIKQRRSNRDFSTQIVSDESIYKLKATVNWAASSCNKQPLRLFVANDPILAGQCLACCKGGTGFSAHIPSFWVFTADSRGYVWPSEMFLPSVDTSLGAQNLFLAAQTLGITGTILSWAQKSKEEELKLRTLLNIPREYIIVFCAVLGYASHNYLPPQRKNIE